MLEILSFGLIAYPTSFLGLATSGYVDTSSLCTLHAYQSTLLPMIGTSVVAACGPQRLMYDEDVKSFIYVTEALVA